MCTYSWPESAWIDFITSSVTARRSLAPVRSYESKVSGSPILIRILRNRGNRCPGGSTRSVPTMATGITGTLAFSASQPIPVRPR